MKQDGSSTPTDAAALAGELRELTGRLKRRLRQESVNRGLNLSQVAVLGRLYRGECETTSELARAENVRSQSMGHTVSRLQADGFVEARPDPNDGRRMLLSLTPYGRERVEAGRAMRDGWLYRTIQARLDAEEQAALAHAVTLLKRLTEE
ncbi:MarR family winged helix-turn-helix transcriptional regulator [Salinisphaera hydrothermalis]|uniref:Regulatory protein MarR n=1 Tax=Salinisphaera hydrothermalis (strain C41B8) TaxID=1304275 RepID=A0A084IJ36_SALHC|nr:MarR family transcriptional regulator [Salinisphaera hydrothermalis]KEZ76720.1 regulatory protein MarR [Salinisphaera hydrothermalis C41B8]